MQLSNYNKVAFENSPPEKRGKNMLEIRIKLIIL